MSDRIRALSLAGAVLVLVALEVMLARVDVFGRLLPTTRPTGLFSSINYQLSEVVSALYGGPATPRPAVFLGNSQLAAAIYPLGELGDALVAAGAAPGTRAVSLCVFGTAPTDAEVLSRDLAPLHPGVVAFGLSAPDIGTTLARAREMPVTATLDVGWRDGLIPPIDREAQLDRWVRTGWRLYRYRRLLHDLIVVPSERRTSADFLDVFHPPAEHIEHMVGGERARAVVALRPGFERGDRFEEALPYLEALRGPDYLAGLRERWRALVPQPLQLEALRLAAHHVRQAGGRPAWVLLPENPLLDRDPEIGAEVRRKSDEVAALLRAAADELRVPVLDLRTLLPPSRFADLNHILPRDAADVMRPLAAQLADHGLLRD